MELTDLLNLYDSKLLSRPHYEPNKEHIDLIPPLAYIELINNSKQTYNFHPNYEAVGLD